MNEAAGGASQFQDREFFAALLAGDGAAAVRALASFESVNDPRAGAVTRQDFPAMAADAQRFWVPLGADYVPLHRIDGPQRSVTEGLLSGAVADRAFAIPVCAVADGDARELRIYYTLWPLTRAHRVRPPWLATRAEPPLHDVIADYQRALARGDLESILQCFEEDGCAREPSGTPYIHCGAAELRVFYRVLFAYGGGIPLVHGATTDDGVSCAIEYTATRWGRATLPPQAGIAVYARGATGRLHAARIYDDVTPPFE